MTNQAIIDNKMREIEIQYEKAKANANDLQERLTAEKYNKLLVDLECKKAEKELPF